MQPYQNSNDIFHRTRKKNPQIYMEAHKSLNAQSNLKQKEQFLEASPNLISNYTIDL